MCASASETTWLLIFNATSVNCSWKESILFAGLKESVSVVEWVDELKALKVGKACSWWSCFCTAAAAAEPFLQYLDWIAHPDDGCMYQRVRLVLWVKHRGGSRISETEHEAEQIRALEGIKTNHMDGEKGMIQKKGLIKNLHAMCESLLALSSPGAFCSTYHTDKALK